MKINNEISLAKHRYKKGEIITLNDLMPYERGQLCQRLINNRARAKKQLDKIRMSEQAKTNYYNEIREYIKKKYFNK